MHKKNLLTIIPLTCAAASIAAGTMGEMPATKQPFDGIYIGAEGGILNTFDNIKSSQYFFNYVVYSQYSNTTLNPNNNTFGSGSFSAGIGKIFFDQVYLGIEAAALIGTKKNNVSTHTQNINNDAPLQFTNFSDIQTNTVAKMNIAEFDLDLKLGSVFYQNNLFYGRIGAAFNKLTMSNTVNLLTINGGEPLTGIALANKSESIVGLRAGLGMEHAVNQYVSLRLDYTYTWYPSLNATATANIYYTTGTIYFQNGVQSTFSGYMDTQNVLLGVNLYLDSLFS